MKFIPHSNLISLDPIWTPAAIVRNHGYMVWDTLYGVDDSYRPQPQMAAGHVFEDGDRLCTITLRDGLRFHDDTPVLARDCVASLDRWGKRDGFAQALIPVTAELSPPARRWRTMPASAPSAARRISRR